MTTEPNDRKRALNDLFDHAFDDVDPAEDSPLYTQLQSLDKRYEDLELIAVGGMKRIFKALDRQGNRHVAMARLHEDASDLLFDPFIREAQLTALLDHPNVISVHDVGVDSTGQPYFTMDLKVGDGLDVVLKKAKNDKSPLADRLDIFIKVCDAITYAHSRKVIHLDLKPANIQVGSFGEVLVCDWGLAKLIGGSEIINDEELLNPDLLNEMTIYGTVKGTPGYMAPEQILGEERDHRTDIYALGALMYAILTCHHPVQGDTQTMLKSALIGNIIPPTERSTGVPKSLSDVVMKAMSLNPEDRYQSVSALIADVRAFLGGYSPVAHKSSAWTEFRLYYKRNRSSCNVAAFFLAIVVIGAAIFVDRLNAKKSEAEALAKRLKIEKQETELLAERLKKEKQESESLAERLQIEKKQTESLLDEAVEEASSIFFEAPLESYRLSMRSLNDTI
jgi:serine/threonine-protein kinase